MPTTNRPFFAGFLAAFRARSGPTFSTSTSTGSTGAATSASLSASSHGAAVANNIPSHPSAAASNPRSITTKAGHAWSQSQNTANVASSPVVSPSSATSGAPPASLSRSPHATTSQHHHVGIPMSPPGATTPLSRGRQRRGSDSSSSSGGFRDILGPEKWYIGGRTATGEEKFYRLGLVNLPGGGIAGSGKRVRSLDRLSV